ncbi:putative fruit bromelain [Helianthus debilis subsp. tardiflorus]
MLSYTNTFFHIDQFHSISTFLHTKIQERRFGAMAASDEADRKRFEEWMKKQNKVHKSDEEKEIRLETFKINLQGRFGPMAASAKSDEERFEDYIKQYKKEYKTEDERKHRFKSFQINLRHIDAYEAFVADQHPVFHAEGLNQYTDLTAAEYLRDILGRDENVIPPYFSWSDSDSDGEMVWYRHGYVRDAKGEDEEEDGEEEEEDDDEEEDGEKEEDGDEEEDEGVDFRAEGKGKDKGELEVEVDVSVKRQRRDCK